MFYMGIGNTCFSIYDIRNSYLKSIKTLPLCTKEKRIIDFNELGFSRLLLDTLDYKELKEYANHFLGKIKEYDKKMGLFFLKLLKPIFYVTVILIKPRQDYIFTVIHVCID